MSRILASAALSLLLGGIGLPALAQVATPEAEPRSYLSPTDETEPTPRVPPVTQPKPMERTRMGEPADAAPPDRVAPPERTEPSPNRVAQPPRATTARRVAQQRTPPSPRRIVRAPGRDDTSLEAIFKQRRFDAAAPPATLAPRSGPAARDPGTRRTMTYNYAPAPPALPPQFDGAPCRSRPSAALAPLFACTLR